MKYDAIISISYDSDAIGRDAWHASCDRGKFGACGDSAASALVALASIVEGHVSGGERLPSQSATKGGFERYPVYLGPEGDWTIRRYGNGQTITEAMASADFFGIEWDGGDMTRHFDGFKHAGCLASYRTTSLTAKEATNGRFLAQTPMAIWFRRQRPDEHVW